MTVFDTLQDRAAAVLFVQHGEAVSVRVPGVGEPRDVQFLFTEVDDLATADQAQSEIEQLAGDCLRDESNPRGGIADPQLGLTILRSGETRAYAFTGAVLRRSPTMIRLLFRRPRLARLGTSHRQNGPS
jgi:hypothetical protein